MADDNAARRQDVVCGYDWDQASGKEFGSVDDWAIGVDRRSGTDKRVEGEPDNEAFDIDVGGLSISVKGASPEYHSDLEHWIRTSILGWQECGKRGKSVGVGSSGEPLKELFASAPVGSGCDARFYFEGELPIGIRSAIGEIISARLRELDRRGLLGQQQGSVPSLL